VEEVVRGYREAPQRSGGPAAAPERDPRLGEAEEILADALATRVRVERGRRKGKVVIEFGSDEDLTRIVETIAGGT
jgi:ParB family chromosome partitioning protein